MIAEGEAPTAAAAAIAAPAGLVKAERAYWEQFAPLLAGAKVLTPADVETLADYCRACVAVDERGRRLRTAFRKRVLDNQTVRMLDSQLRGWVEKKTRLAGELGLTAISRTRVAWSGHEQRIDPVKQPQSKLAQLQEEATLLRRPLSLNGPLKGIRNQL
jgi:phage terminase small subunit